MTRRVPESITPTSYTLLSRETGERAGLTPAQAEFMLNWVEGEAKVRVLDESEESMRVQLLEWLRP